MSALVFLFLFFFNDTATTEIYTLSLHDALPILPHPTHLDGLALLHDHGHRAVATGELEHPLVGLAVLFDVVLHEVHPARSEEHTSELQSRQYLVCRLLLEKKKK